MMESQFSREVTLESYLKTMLDKKFKYDDQFLHKYKHFKDSRTIPVGLTWEQMKKNYDWGYRKGSLISPLLTWIYLRSDVNNSLNKGEIESTDLIEKFKLNEHYFLVEKKAIAYLKLHCNGFKAEEDESSDSDDQDDNESQQSEMSYRTHMRRKRLLSSVPFGIDDMAVEDTKNK